MNFRAKIEAYCESKTELANLSLFVIMFTGALLLMVFYNWPGQTQFLYLRNPAYHAPAAFGLLPIPTLEPSASIAAGVGFIISLIMAFLGVRTRLALGLAFVCYFFYFGQMIDYTFVRRKTNLIPLVLLTLTVAPNIHRCGLLPFLRKQDAEEPVEAWPLFVVKGLISMVYLLFAYTKLFKAGGFGWAEGESLQAYLLTFYLYGDMQYALWLAQHPLLCTLMSWFTIVFELTFWMVVFWPRLTWPFVLAGLIFHSGIAWFMEIYYIKYFGLTYVVFFDLHFFRWLARRHNQERTDGLALGGGDAQTIEVGVDTPGGVDPAP